MFLGEMIHNYRKTNQLTLKDFSLKAGLSVAYINQLERNRNPKTNAEIIPSFGTFVKVANAMGITLDQLLQEVDENQPIGLTSPGSQSDVSLSPSESNLITNYRNLNEEGQEKLMEYSEDLLASGRYIKSDEDGMVEEAK